ncbi:MAG: hypothetical protein HPY44_09165 [Armatimonadetes bacterium]|nr:hypothetical protein [Armatimonadota bacterium]
MTPRNESERVLTPAQQAHLQRLYAGFEQAQRQLNDFVTYLMAEHELENPDQWQLSADLTRFKKMGAPPEQAG